MTEPRKCLVRMFGRRSNATVVRCADADTLHGTLLALQSESQRIRLLLVVFIAKLTFGIEIQPDDLLLSPNSALASVLHPGLGLVRSMSEILHPLFPSAPPTGNNRSPESDGPW